MAEHYIVNGGKTSTGIELYENDSMYVYGDGKACETVINSSGVMYVSNGGSASETAVNSGGVMHVSNGGSACKTEVNSSGVMYVSNGGSACKTEINYYGVMHVSDGGKAIETEVNFNGTVNVSEGGVASLTTLNQSGVLNVSYGGSARETTVKYDGHLRVLEGGVATITTLSEGYLTIRNGGKAINTTLNRGGAIFAKSDGILDSLTVNDGGQLQISGGAIASNTTVSSGGGVWISSGGKLTGKTKFADGANVTVQEGAILDFDLTQPSAGAAAPFVNGLSVVKDQPFAYTLTVTDSQADGLNYLAGGAADFDKTITVKNTSGEERGLLTVKDGTKVIDGRKYTLKLYGSSLFVRVGEENVVLDGDLDHQYDLDPCEVASSVNINQGGHLSLLDVAVAIATTVNDGGNLSVLNGGTAIETTVIGGGNLNVSKGGTAIETTVKGGALDVSEGGTVNGTTVINGGRLDVKNGGTANDTTIEKGGNLIVSNGGTVNGTTVRDTVEYGFSILIDTGGTANDTTIEKKGALTVKGTANNIAINNYGYVMVYGGGTVNNTTVINKVPGGDAPVGELTVSNDGTANNTTVNNGGNVSVENGGKANNTTVNDGKFYVKEDGTAIETSVNNGGIMHVSEGGVASTTTVSKGGVLNVSEGGVASITTINNGGALNVSGGGVASITTVSKGGTLNVSQGGTAAGTTIEEDGNLIVSSGGKLTGKITFEDYAKVSAKDGAIFDFGISALSPGDDALVNDLSFVMYQPFSYTLTVSGSEANGDYILAEYAKGFNKTITVVNSTGKDLGTLTVGGKTLYKNGRTYTLAMDGLNLVVTVGTAPDNIFCGDLENEERNIYTGSSAVNVNVKEKGWLYISEGGVAIDTTVYQDGKMNVYEGGVASNTTLNSGGLHVYVGKFEHTTINGGQLLVSQGGVAIDTTVNDGELHVYSGKVDLTKIRGGQLLVSRGGVANDTTVNAGGILRIYDGGKLTGKMTFEAGAVVDVSKRGTVDFDLRQTTAPADPLLNDFSFVTDDKLSFTLTVSDTQANGLYYLAGKAADFGDRTITVVNASGEELDTLTVDGTKEIGGREYTLKQYGRGLYLWVGGEKYDLTGELWDENFNLKDGKVAGSVFVMERACLNIADGGIALDTTVYPEGAIDVSKDGTANGVTVDGGDVDVSAGGTVNGATVDCGWMRVSAGGTVNGATVNEDGKMFVSSGGTAVGIVASTGAYLRFDVAPDTYVKGTYDGSAFEIKDGFVGGYTIRDACELNVSNGGTADNTTVNAGGWMSVSAGGTADNTTVNAGGRMYVQNGGTAQQLKENGGWVDVENGATVTFVSNSFSGTVLQDWHSATVHSGTTATDVAVNANGWFLVNGGVASQANVNADGLLTVKDGGSAGGAKLKAGGQIHIYDGTAGNTTVSSGGEMYIYADGTADKTTVNAGGRMIVSEGGIAKATTVNTDASVHVSTGGKTNGFTVNSGGYLGVFAGGSATGIVENGGYVYVDDGAQVTFAPNSFSGLVLNKKDATVHSGTTATDITVSGKGGMLVVFSGGLTNDVTVGPEGVLWINKDGLTNGLTVKSGGELIAGAGGKLTGRMAFEHGATVAPGAKAYLNFDLAQTAPGETALVNNLSFIPDTFTFTLTVDGTPENGLYSLAGGAAGFDQTLHVITFSGEELGTLTVDGGTKTIGGGKYTLIRDEDELSLLVGDPLPPEPLNNDLVYKAKTDNDNKAVTGSYGNRLKAAGQEIRLDQIDSINHDGYHNRVEKAVDDDSDNIDYAKIVLKHGAKLSFHAEATAAATFTVYGLKQNKKGKYSLKKLQTLKLTDKDKDGVFTADSKKLLQLQVSGAYYVSMQYTDKHADEAYYNVSLNDDSKERIPGSVFYDLGYNGDDWTGKKTKDLTGLFADLGTVDAARLKTDNTIIKDEWIGFGDKVDCKKFTLESAAELSFKVSAPDGPLKLSVCKLKTSGTGDKTTYSLVKVKTITVKAGKESANLDNLRLEAGDYFFKVESTNINKSTGYNVQITQSTFYSDGDDKWNNVLLVKKNLSIYDALFCKNGLGTGKVYFDKAGNDKESDDHASFVCETNKKTYENFVGYGDEIDFAKITLPEGADANVTFSLTATGDATLEVFKVTKKGEDKYTKKSIQTLKLKVGDDEEKTEQARKTVTLEYKDDAFYYISVKATNTKKMPMVYYNVSYTIESMGEASALSMPETASAASALAMPEISDSLGISDALSFGGYDADVLADASASSLADLDDRSGWMNIANLA